MVDDGLTEVVQENIEVLKELAATGGGTHDAGQLLRLMNHSASEAACMAAPFGHWLKAARGDYIPNKRLVEIGFAGKEVEVSLYHPTKHAYIIQPAYGLFKSLRHSISTWIQ